MEPTRALFRSLLDQPLMQSDAGGGGDTGTGSAGSSDDGTSGGDASGEKAAKEPNWQEEAEKFKALSRKHEERAKANADAVKELERLKQSSMSETEKAVAQARQEAKTEALRESAERLVDAKVEAAAAGRKVDVPALLEGLNRSRFVTDDGEVDSKAIVAWVERIAPKPSADLGQGNRGASGAPDMNQLIRSRMRG